MNKIFQICEIAATVLETAILLEFINKLLGSKLRGIRNILQLLCAFVLINGYMITSAHISVKYSAVFLVRKFNSVTIYGKYIITINDYS